MLKQARVFFVVFALIFLIIAVPVSLSSSVKSRAYSFLEGPLSFSGETAIFLNDFFSFRENASEIRRLKQKVAAIAFKNIQTEELYQENLRLTKLLNIRQIIPSQIRRIVYARVIARSPSTWDKVLLIDKGSKEGLSVNHLILLDYALVGKVIEVGPSVSKILLITDPNMKIGALIQRTRQQGILYGTSQGEIRAKYFSIDSEIKSGDIIETAGFKNYFPKGIPAGVVEKVWKEPGQMYQVVKIKPIADMNHPEEVLYIE